MHIATATAYNNSLEALMKRQTAMSQTQEQLTTGKRVNRASDDPAAAARAERALAAEARSTANQRAVDASNNAMTLTESALGDAGDLLQQIREKLVQAGDASLTDADRKSLAGEISELRKQLLSIANRSDGAGTYLFGGQSADQQPFVDAAGGVQFTGEAGAQQAASGEPLPLTVDGQTAWMSARTGNGTFVTGAGSGNSGSAWIDTGHVVDPSAVTGHSYTVTFDTTTTPTTYTITDTTAGTTSAPAAFTSPQAIQVDGMSATISGVPANGDSFTLDPSTPTLSVFDAVDKAIADLSTPNRTSSQNTQANTGNLAALDAVAGQLQALRSQVGATLNRVDGVTNRLSALKLASQTERSNAEDVDMTQAISDFTNQQTGYDAALKSYSMVQKLSLFNYLG